MPGEPYARPDAETERLLHEAEIRAEQFVATLRMLASVGLFLALLISSRFDLQLVVFRLERGGPMLAAYFLLGAASWLACRRGAFRPWMAWPAATADSAFFLADLWLRLHAAGLPGTVGFLYPSMWLVMLVLALGALRINPWLQAFVAAVTVAGLAGIIAHGAGPGTVPAIGIAGMFASFPANAMRIAIISLAAVILVTATFRARARMLRSIHEARRNANLTRYLPEQLAGVLADTGLDALRRGELVQMGILFIDIRGFTRWSQGRPPHEVYALMSAFRRHVQAVVRDTGGIIDKFIGDAAMVVFPEGADARASARTSMDCAVRLSQVMADWSEARRKEGLPAVRIGIGLHWGEVFAGVIGDEHRLEYSVFGDAVNTAARLEELARDMDMEIVASRDVLDRCSETGRAAGPPEGWEMLGARVIRGRSGTVEIVGMPFRRPARLVWNSGGDIA